MRSCRIVRVFTRGGAGGNHLGVVTDPAGLDTDDMQQVARRLGYSETVFIDHDHGDPPTARIFTPGAELPFAGHPLVGASWVIRTEQLSAAETISCPVGDVGTRVEDDVFWIDPPMGGRSVGPCTIDVGGWAEPIAAHTVLMPLEYHVLQLASPTDVASAEPAPFEGFTYLWAWEEPARVAKVRFFASDIGVVEDPATGSAAVALAEVLIAAGVETGNLTLHQGDEIGAPSTLRLAWEPGRISVGGTVADDGSIDLDR